MAKSMEQLYAQWNRVFNYFTCADYDMSIMDFNNTHARIIDFAIETMECYHRNIAKHFGSSSDYISNDHYSTPVERYIYAKK